MAEKRKQSPQEHAKREQAAKKRHRLHGQFAAGANPKSNKPSENPLWGTSPEHKRQLVQDEYANRRHKLMTNTISERDLKEWSRQGVRSRVMGGAGPEVPNVEEPPTTARTSDVRALQRSTREGRWRSSSGIYEQPGAKGAPATRKYMPTGAFISKELAPSHKQWLDDQLKDPSSEFNAGLDIRSPTHGGRYSPGQRNRLRLYTNALQEGKSHPEALEALRHERRGRRPGAAATTPRQRITGREPQFNRHRGRAGKYETSAPTNKEFQFGISAAAADKISELENKFPNLEERDLVRLQQYQRMNIADEMLKNSRWTHETQRANILGKTPGRESTSDRVVFFTTSVGQPAVSIPSDSLIGQYVIRRRKQFLKKEGVYSDAQLKGKFPETVRDMHIVEAGSGVSLGAEGRWGAYQKTGWRAGAKKSRGWGKPIPVGQSVLTDSQGRPLYDSYGNIRYTEGATRPFEVGLQKDLGFRVFLG